MKKRKNLKEQATSSVKPKGLPSPGELANRISSSGMSGEEVMAWLGSVLSRAGMSAGTKAPAEPEVEIAAVEEVPAQTPAAMQEQLEERLLKNLLLDIKQSTRKKK